MDIQLLVKHDGAVPVPVVIHAGVKIMECSGECGVQFLVSSRTKNQPRCFNCGIRAMVECQKQMHAKSGPYYDRWKAAVAESGERWATGCKLAAERYARGGEPA